MDQSLIDKINEMVEAGKYPSLSHFAYQSARRAIDQNVKLDHVRRGDVSIRVRYPIGFITEIRSNIDRHLQPWLVAAMTWGINEESNK